MSVDYDATLLVGVYQRDITFETLTDKGKAIVHEAWLDGADDEDKEFYGDLAGQYAVDYMNEWFEHNWSEYDLWYELGLEAAIYNAYSGNYYQRGVNLYLYDPSKAAESIETSVNAFKEIVNIEPSIYCDVTVS